jgi:hypothetical protein
MTSRRAWWLAAAAGAAAVVGIAVWARSDPLTSAARRKWKDQAIGQIERRLADREVLAVQTQRVTSAASTRPVSGGWVGDDLLVMRNGDWIVCRNICRKEDPQVHDLFLGRGSDGRWYYSTFHFCIDKVVLRFEPQPQNLGEFVQAYWLAPFDGRSDECLKVTWSGGPWGAEKLQAGRIDNSPK